jgi:hypothetical protein
LASSPQFVQVKATGPTDNRILGSRLVLPVTRVGGLPGNFISFIVAYRTNRILLIAYLGWYQFELLTGYISVITYFCEDLR